MNQHKPCRNPAIRHLPDVANISLGFLPLNHLLGRMAIVQCMVSGGSTAFVRASQSCAWRICTICLTLHIAQSELFGQVVAEPALMTII